MGEKYAVLISGDLAENGFDCFWNDVVLMREALIQNGFQSNHIYVLYGDGADYFDANRPNPIYRPSPSITNFPANQANVTNVFNGLANGTNGLPQSTDDDLLFIWTFDHGNSDGTNSYLCLRDGGMRDTTFSSLVNQIPYAYRIICMQQCFSGGFIPHLSNDRTVVVTACTANQVAWPADDEKEVIGGVTYTHGEFNFHLLSAIAGHTVIGTPVNADADSNGFVTMKEVFSYIQTNDSITIETPQYNDGTLRLGDKLHLSFADLFIRDNILDSGMEPLTDGGISCSPDINHFRNELANPQVSLCDPAAKSLDNLFDNVEYGQTNYIYVRLQNRGYSASDADVSIYWSKSSTLPTPGSWNFVGNINVPSINPGEFKAAGPLEWSTVPAIGHYCFIAVLGNTQDPKPDINNIHNIDDFYSFIRQSNNVTWKNFDVYDLFANSFHEFNFLVQGWPKISYKSDIEIMLQLSDMIKVELVLLKRLAKEAIPDGLTLIKETKLYSHFSVNSKNIATLKNIALKTSDKSLATLRITIPDIVPDGVYRISVLQKIGGKEMGRVTKNLRIGQYPYMGNGLTKEIHKSNCEWAAQISPRHKIAYINTDLALQHGFNGCRFCLPEFDTDR